MTTALSPTTTNKALITLGDEQVVVRLDDEGCLERYQRKVRLFYGPHLYAACKPGNERPDEKIVPYQPGYSAIVEAMSGILFCPPVWHEADGTTSPNPRLSVDERSGIAYRSEARAVCVLRHPITGALVPSVGHVIVDARLQFQQALLKINREDVVRLVADDQADDLRAGDCKGWLAQPTGAGLTILANLRTEGVREKLQDYLHLTGTLLQRSVTKAERLAADHHPFLRGRCIWRWDQLRQEGGTKQEDGRVVGGRRYVEMAVAGWVEQAHGFDRRRLSDLLEAVASQADLTESVEPVLDVVGADPDDTPEPERQIEQQSDIPEEIPAPPERERVPVEAPPEKAAERPAPREPGNGNGKPDQLARLRADVAEGLGVVGREAWAAAKVPESPIEQLTREQLIAMTAAIGRLLES